MTFHTPFLVFRLLSSSVFLPCPSLVRVSYICPSISPSDHRIRLSSSLSLSHPSAPWQGSLFAALVSAVTPGHLLASGDVEPGASDEREHKATFASTHQHDLLYFHLPETLTISVFFTVEWYSIMICTECSFPIRWLKDVKVVSTS